MSAPVDLEEAAKAAIRVLQYRCLENVRPGQWWLGDYRTDEGVDYRMWAQVGAVIDLTHRVTGAKLVRVVGTCTDGEDAEITQYRGYSVSTVTDAQARKAGLAVPA